MTAPTTPKKWGPIPIVMPRVDRRNFKNLEFLGTVPISTRMGDHIDHYRRISSVAHVSTHSNALIELAGEQFYVVNPTVEMVETVLNSWEQRPPFDEKPPSLDKALEHLSFFYKEIFANCKASDEQIYEWLDLSRSPGYPGTQFKLKTKMDQLQDPGFQAYKQEFRFNRRAFHKITPKVEILPLENIKQKKCRLFVIPELLLVLSQIKFGKMISLRLKKFGWSAYGFNPYNGGCNKLAEELLSKPVRFFYDVSGWDKFINLLRKIFEIIKKHCGYETWTDEEREEFDWMVENTCEMDCVFYDGSVYRKKYGNGSGSGTTTRDNILGHIIIMAAMLYHAYFLKYDKYPDPFLVQRQIIRLFGDDSICAVDIEFEYILNKGFVEQMFASFGMKLKFFYGGIDYPLEKMEFLGFKFFKTEHGWIPLYDEVRLATGMIYNGVHSNSREAILSKISVLSFMAFPCAHYSIFKSYAQDVAKYFHSQGNLTPSEEALIDLILYTQSEELLSIFLGLESSSREVFELFSSLSEVVGIKELFPTLSFENEKI